MVSKTIKMSLPKRIYKFPTYIILFLFMLYYVGTEVSFGSLFLTYAVKSELKFSKGRAASLAAVSEDILHSQDY